MDRSMPQYYWFAKGSCNLLHVCLTTHTFIIMISLFNLTIVSSFSLIIFSSSDSALMVVILVASFLSSEHGVLLSSITETPSGSL